MPRVNGTETLSVSRDEVWRLLNDPDMLAASIPGCRGFERDAGEEHRYRTAIKVAVGAVTSVYEGTVEYTDVAEPERCTIVVAGKGDKGAIDGRGAITLVPSGSGTEVSYEGEFKLTGPIAGVGQRMAPGISRKMIVETLRNLEAHAGAETGADPDEAGIGDEGGAGGPASGADAETVGTEAAQTPASPEPRAGTQDSPKMSGEARPGSEPRSTAGPEPGLGSTAPPTAGTPQPAPAAEVFRPFTISPVAAFVAGLIIGGALGVAAAAAWL